MCSDRRVFCLRSPQQTVVVLTLVLGGFWLIRGVRDIVAGIGGRGQPMRGWTIVGGVIGLVDGIVVLASPEATAVTFAWLLGILLVVQGVLAIVVTFARPRSTAPTPTTGLEATSEAGQQASG